MKAKRFLRACCRRETDCTPVWLMRQAGRYMREYREMRSKYSFFTMCKTPELAVKVTLLPVDRFDVDAAILFADILLPLEGMGLSLRFTENKGPVIDNPVRNETDIQALRLIEPEEDVSYVLEAVRLVQGELDGKIPLIGFSGAPFTLASYMIEGGSSKNYLKCKRIMWETPQAWHELMQKVSKVVLNYLKAQIEAGVQAVQIFDSWVGTLAPEDYAEFVLPYSRYVIQMLEQEEVPVIHFVQNAATLLEVVRKAGGDVVGVDWRVDLDVAWRRLGDEIAIQGNLDPAVLLAPPAVIRKKVKNILYRAQNRPGHIFNLGHGVHPETPVEHVEVLVEAVHEYSCYR